MKIFSKLTLFTSAKSFKPWSSAFNPFLNFAPSLQSGWQATTYANGNFIAKNGKYFSTSTDGITWSTPYEAVISGTNVEQDFINTTELAYIDGKYILMGVNIRSFFSDDGINWERRNAITPTLSEMSNLLNDGTKLIVVDSQNGILYTSTDGYNWNSTTNSAVYSGANKIAYNGSLYYLTRNINYLIYTSSDLVNWTSTTTSVGDSFIQNLTILAYEGYMIFGNSNIGTTTNPDYRVSYTNENGRWWTGITQDENLGSHPWRDIANDNFRYVLLSPDGYISTKRV